MKKFDKSFRRSSGFTLIELLIVIVIIGILAGILIAVINPVRQQNRSRNAGIKAGILKAAFSVNAVRAGTGTLPTGTQLGEETENITPAPITHGCDSTTTLDCKFQISGTILPATCGPDYILPIAAGINQCYFHVLTIGTELRSGMFRVVGAQFDLNPQNRENKFFVFDSAKGLLDCPGTVASYGVGQDLAACPVVNQ